MMTDDSSTMATPFELEDLPPYISFLVEWVELKDLNWWNYAPSFGALSETLSHLPVLSIVPQGGAWDENSEALGLFIADLLERIASKRHTLLLYAEGNLSNRAGDLVPLFPYIFHGGDRSRFYLSECLCTNPKQTALRYTTTTVAFEYNPVQLKRMMTEFNGNAFRLNTSFGGAFWPNNKVKDGLKFEYNLYHSALTLMVDCPLWFDTNRDFDSLVLKVPAPAWRKKVNAAINATLQKVGAQRLRGAACDER